MEKVILILISIIPLMYQVVGLKDAEFNNIQYIPMFSLNIALMFYFWKKKIRLKRETLIVFFMLCIAVLIVPFFMYMMYKTLFITNIMYTLFYFDFIVMILLITNYMTGDNFNSSIGSLLVGNTVLLLINIINNKNDISVDKCIDNITHILKFVDKKEILYFGFNHPNLVSMFIIIEMFLLYQYGKTTTNTILKVLSYLCMVVWIIPLIATGSRTAIIGSVIFVICKIFLWCFFKVKIHWKILIVSISIIMLCMVGVKINFNRINLTESMLGRKTDVINLFSYLDENNKIISGIGPTNSTESYVSNWGIEGTPDNGYLAIIAQYGMIGFALILLTLIYAFYLNINIKNSTNCALIITFFIYSCMENVLFVSRVWMCVVMWIFIVNFRNDDKNLIINKGEIEEH